MMNSSPIRPNLSGCALPAQPRRPRGEDGYILLIVMFMLALLIISMAVALPKMATEIQRDREIETFHRGMQYRRAIQVYFKKYNRYPPNMDALVKTNEIRFLRKKYLDPMTGKDDWKPIMVGQNKTPMAMGFFGQPLGGIGPMAGIGPGGVNAINGAAGNNNLGSSFGSNSSFGNNSSFGSNSSFGGNSSFGSNSGFGGNSGSSSIFGSNSNTAAGASSTSNPTDANGNPVDPNTGSTPVGAGPIFGGAGIIGVSPASPKMSLFVYKKKNHYNDWEFLYSPLSDQMNMTGGNYGAIQPSIPGYGAPGTGYNPTGGVPPGATGTSGSGSTGTTDGGTGTTPTTPPAQPQ